MQVEVRRISDLTADPENARTHDKKNLDAIASSLEKFGQRKPIVVMPTGVILAGNGTWAAAKQLGWTEITVSVTPADWDYATAKAYALADNRTAELAEWDTDILASQLIELDAEGWDITALGFDVPNLDEDSPIVEDDVPLTFEDAPAKAALGDVWQLGPHRVMCGDSTNPEHVAKLMNGQIADLIHADPPYGMGKEKDGVENDNLYAEKLDEFQLAWFKTVRPHVADNASAYIWGNPEDLWRLWFRAGLSRVERLTFRNQILWQQEGISWGKDGMSGLRQYANMGEHCLFFMMGEQGFNNNADNYWTGWDALIAYLDGERLKMGWSIKDTKRIAGHSENSGCHWFDKSQWSMPTEAVYKSWQEAAKNNGFKRDYNDIKQEFYSTRAYFDSGHDQMSDVWRFDRVKGEERHGHATPKPVQMMARVMKSSLPKGGLVVEPFGGSGSTLIGAEQTGRVCYTMELTPQYVDTIVKRWEALTGQKAQLL